MRPIDPPSTEPHTAAWDQSDLHCLGCSAEQELLRKAHGTPEEFTDAVINAIGEISVMEAQAAIAKYRQQWAEAGTWPKGSPPPSAT